MEIFLIPLGMLVFIGAMVSFKSSRDEEDADLSLQQKYVLLDEAGNGGVGQECDMHHQWHGHHHNHMCHGNDKD